MTMKQIYLFTCDLCGVDDQQQQERKYPDRWLVIHDKHICEVCAEIIRANLEASKSKDCIGGRD